MVAQPILPRAAGRGSSWKPAGFPSVRCVRLEGGGDLADWGLVGGWLRVGDSGCGVGLGEKWWGEVVGRDFFLGFEVVWLWVDKESNMARWHILCVFLCSFW